VASQKTEALVLRSVDFGESDRICHLLAPDIGRLTAIAKGARRSVQRFPGTLDLFNHLRISVWRSRSGKMARLEQATLIESFTSLRSNPARFALGCFLLELLDRLAPEDGARADTRRLFAFALFALDAVATRTPDARLRLLLELRGLDALGLRPELSACVRCGSAPEDAQVGFHVADGGVLCGRCSARETGLLTLHLGTLRALDRVLRLDLKQLDRLVLDRATLGEARLLVSRFQRFHVGVELKSQRFLDGVFSGPAERA